MRARTRMCACACMCVHARSQDTQQECYIQWAFKFGNLIDIVWQIGKGLPKYHVFLKIAIAVT